MKLEYVIHELECSRSMNHKALCIAKHCALGPQINRLWTKSPQQSHFLARDLCLLLWVNKKNGVTISNRYVELKMLRSLSPGHPVTSPQPPETHSRFSYCTASSPHPAPAIAHTAHLTQLQLLLTRMKLVGGYKQFRTNTSPGYKLFCTSKPQVRQHRN